jgi:hypothetical protein
VYKPTRKGQSCSPLLTPDVQYFPKTGLTAACIKSPHSHDFVAQAVLEYIKRWIPDQRVGLLAGNSVHADRGFLVEHMPGITDWLHYRSVSIAELLRKNADLYMLISIGLLVSKVLLNPRFSAESRILRRVLNQGKFECVRYSHTPD